MLAFRERRLVWSAISVIISVASWICWADWLVRFVCFCTAMTDSLVFSLISFNSSKLSPAVLLYSFIFSELLLSVSTFDEVSSSACPISDTFWFAFIVSFAWSDAPPAISSTAVLILEIESEILWKESENWPEKSSRAFEESVMLVRIPWRDWIRLWIALAISPTSSLRFTISGFISKFNTPFATLPRLLTAPSKLLTIRITM